VDGIAHARELACRREADATGLELASRFRQRFERFGNAELLLREARPVAEQPLNVLVERAKPQLHVGARAERAQ
jgi:hypothetical protein